MFRKQVLDDSSTSGDSSTTLLTCELDRSSSSGGGKDVVVSDNVNQIPGEFRNSKSVVIVVGVVGVSSSFFSVWSEIY